MMHAIILVVTNFNDFVKRAPIQDNKFILYKKGDHLDEEIYKINNKCNEVFRGKIYSGLDLWDRNR